jgi:hypothetical protein
MSAQMGGPSTSYILSIIPSSTTSIPMNYFIMANLSLTSGVSSGESQFYGMGNPKHRVPSIGGNIYPHMNNPYHVSFSLQVYFLRIAPLKPFMSHLGGGYYLTKHGHGVYQNLGCPMISQTQYFLGALLAMDYGRKKRMRKKR